MCVGIALDERLRSPDYLLRWIARDGRAPGDCDDFVMLMGALWTAVGTVLGLLLGVGVSVVLVHVVNPQSFHWTMDLSLPLPRLAALAAAVMAAGIATAWLSGRAAAGREMVLAVKEDW